METIKLSRQTVELLLDLVAAQPAGKAGLSLGQDIATLNRSEKKTENQILEEHSLQKAQARHGEIVHD